MAVGEKFPVVMGVEKAANNGVATLDENGILVESQQPEKLKWQSNENLLHNWYFIGGGSQQGGGQFPINQRGQTEYTENGYNIDRWTKWHVTSLQLVNEGIEIQAPQVFCQIIDSEEFFGRMVTLSVLFDQVVGSWSIQVVDGIASVVSSPGLATVSGILNQWENNPAEVRIFNTDQGKCKIKAAKLELGPVQTLAHQDSSGNWVLNDPPPNFQQELAKCQRYFYVSSSNMGQDNPDGADVAFSSIGTYAQCGVRFPVTMRATPSVQLKYVSIWNGAQTNLLDSQTIIAGSVTREGFPYIQNLNDGFLNKENYYLKYIASADL